MSIIDHAPINRLYWDGRRGMAVGPRGRRELLDKPQLGFRFVEVDYSVICKQVRPESWHPVRDMCPDEAALCDAFLRAQHAP